MGKHSFGISLSKSVDLFPLFSQGFENWVTFNCTNFFLDYIIKKQNLYVDKLNSTLYYIIVLITSTTRVV